MLTFLINKQGWDSALQESQVSNPAHSHLDVGKKSEKENEVRNKSCNVDDEDVYWRW